MNGYGKPIRSLSLLSIDVDVISIEGVERMDNEEQIEVTTELESEPRFFRYSRANGQVQMFLNVDHILFVTFTVGGEAKITMSNGADFTVAPSNPEYEKLWDYLNE